MRQGDTKLFKDKQKLYKMVNLRRNGWAFTSLELIFGCSRISIQDQCKKYQIYPLNEVFTIERIISKSFPKADPNERKWAMIGDNKVCLGRTYKEYQEKYLHRK